MAKEIDELQQSLNDKNAPGPAAASGLPAEDVSLENAVEAWIGKVQLLSKYKDMHPEWHIPQMAYLSEDDWLSATRGKLETEADFRLALANLRFLARKKTATDIGNALKSAVNAQGRIPADPRDLLPYLPSGFDAAILDHMQINAPTPSNGKLPLASAETVLVDRPVSRWDSYFLFDAKGNWAVNSATPSEHFAISSAINAFIRTHGSPPTDYSQIGQYPDVRRLDQQNGKEVFEALTSKPKL